MTIVIGLLTIVVAGGAAGIAFMQWRTAHLKVVLDLFERRYAIYKAAFDALEEFFAALDSEAENAIFIRFKSAADEAIFFFGNEAVDGFAKLRQELIDNMELRRRARAGDPLSSGHLRQVQNLQDSNIRLANLRKDLRAACLPYMRMDQRRVRTPAEWLKDRQTLRMQEKKHAVKRS